MYGGSQSFFAGAGRCVAGGDRGAIAGTLLVVVALGVGALDSAALGSGAGVALDIDALGVGAISAPVPASGGGATLAATVADDAVIALFLA